MILLDFIHRIRPFNLALIIFLFFGLASNAQNVKELEFLLTQPELTQRERIDILYTLSRELTYVDHIKSLEYAEEALNLAIETNDSDGIGYSYRILSSIYAINDNYFMSMEYIHKALDIFEGRKDEEGIANCYISLGHIYRGLKNHGQEINFHSKSFEIFNRLGIKERIGVSAHNLGESLYNNNQFSKAEDLTRFAIRINDSILNLPVLSSCYKVMGLIKENENQIDSANYYYKKVLQISEELGDNAQKVATVKALMRLAEIAKTNKDYNLQFQYLEQAEAFCEKFNSNKSLLEVYHELQTFYLENKNTEKAMYYLNKYNELSNTIHRVQLEDRNRLTESMASIHHLNTTTAALEKENAAQASTIFYRNVSLFITALFLIGLFVVMRKLRRINKELIAQNKTINHQKNELQELNATKNKFFSIVAHDLRSPLASLKSFSSVLVDHIDLLSKEEILEMGKKLDISVDNTLKMADNLIVWAKSQMNVIEDKKEHINLKEVINDILVVFKEIANHKEIKLITSIMGDPYFMGDKDQVEFIIRNLINNAIKFTPRKGIVSVSLTQTTEHIKIVVADTGVGMSSKFRDNLFSIQKSKGIPGTEGEKGSGLGLVLSSEFVKRNDGEIHVESLEEKGTTITVTLTREKNVA